MSALFTIHVTCDGCGETLTSERQDRGSFYRADLLARVHHWLTLEHGIQCNQHYCPLCADAVTFDRKSQTAKGNWKT